ncbi:30S ribosomal protein S12 methylthiotransferase RimO [Clostridium formicaceticum]|uniref:Ribosomal protein uS12 methylthiotransferase RimO n=1 Tax=Clostridium formicaceticum TaxID=1497 RepID=A0AAC9RIP7_9CLOT|nr:30S ribosomal protein S12 methylthiotransferase RimO [Clostridium formicaceticum]AOY77264.1 ribosomal protein S12 methylthiotransferase RimO [Clostridium formicaceticum]ARE87801.1 Ribosomal protein S12 methylthiotransferase RimO [Clostridium formicaceticum]
MNLSVYLESLGCSKNLIDAEVMLGLLNKYGYKLTNDKLKADVIIVNTCGFIESAKEESINKIIEMGELKKDKLKLLIISGCLGERYASELLKELPEVDAIVGTGNYNEIIEIIHESIKGNKIVRIGNVDSIYDESLPRFQTTPTHSAYVKISDGCDNYCTYCIIPKLRGKYRSRKMESIVEEVQQLAENGVKEIILIAQDTTRYGIDLYGEYKFSHLLQQLNEIKGIQWIRLLYCYPEMITDKLIETIAKYNKICKYIDMPIQHCSDEILKKMNRRTNKESLVKTINKLRKEVPEIVIRTSLIVGFPGEEENHFNELLEFVEEMKFDRLGVFMYSQEENTAAAKMPNQVAEDIKEQRQKRIMEIQQKISLDKNNEKISKILEVLVEEELEGSGEYLGRTKGDAPEIDGLVYIQTKTPIAIGDIVPVKITSALEYDLIGEKVDEFSE